MENISLRELLMVIMRYKKMFTLSIGIPMVLALIISLFLPKSYKASVVILAPELESGGSIMETPFGVLGGGSFGGSGMSSQAVIAILKSKRMAEDIVDEFGLMKLYGINTMYFAIRRLQESSSIKLSEEDGTIEVSVVTIDAKLSADIANYYILHLNDLNEKLNIVSKKRVVKVLDPAVPPVKKYKPEIKFNVLTTGVFALFLSLFIIIFREYVIQTE